MKPDGGLIFYRYLLLITTQICNQADKEESVVGRIVEGDTFQNVRKVKVMVRRQ